jgi:outer membrane protein assembly factor BamB
MGKPETDLFVSYNRKDRSFVDLLVRVFEEAGLTCFQDITGLKIFDKLDASLKAAIARSRRLVSIISPSYLQSYWCLFEAMEAIQGQDLEQRFLPLVVRYSPEDQRLDENFVLTAMADLDTQISALEEQIIRLKAFQLGSKVEKLQYIRTKLPQVFQQIYERIFPEFDLWDDDSIRATLRQLLERLAPASKVDVDALPLAFERRGATPVVVPRLAELPTLLWKSKVGIQAWKNSPVVVGNRVYVGSAGSAYNAPDPDDGIYCLDARTGIVAWRAHTPADANAVLVSKGLAITGCDDGSVVAVSAMDGHAVWQRKLDSGIVGGPIKLPANIGNPMLYGPDPSTGRDPILAVTYEGTVYLLALGTGAVIDRLALGTTVLGAPELATVGHQLLILVPGLAGSLFVVEYTDFRVTLARLRDVTITYRDRYASEGTSIASLAARPAFAGGLALQGFVRATHYDDPPLAAVDVASGAVRWLATAKEGGRGFGNLRGTPVVTDDEAIFATAYSDELCAVSLRDGNVTWSVDLGQPMFEQWSSPIAHNHVVFLGRHDGYVHRIDAKARKRDWSVYLGDSGNAGVAVAATQHLPEFDAGASWKAGESSPILGTPRLDQGRLYVGTHEGYLYCLANLGDLE